MPALSIASSVAARRGTSKPKPHVLGGSNNLRSERERREHAEEALKLKNGQLKQIKEELAPQVLKLTDVVKTIQIEKQHQLDLDEASQDVLEALQTQMNALEDWQRRFPSMIDEKLEQAMLQVTQQMTAESHRFELHLDELRNAQEEQTAELCLAYNEFLSGREYLSTRINAAEDATESVRGDCARISERQHLALEAHASKIAEIDEKIFLLDKELLKLKMTLPAPVAANLAAGGGRLNHNHFSSNVSPVLSGIEAAQKVEELASDISLVKAEMTASRTVDRQQIEALTNRLREAAKSGQRLQRDVDSRLTDVETSIKQVVTKAPSEMAKRLLQAQNIWKAELQTLIARLNHFENELQSNHLTGPQIDKDDEAPPNKWIEATDRRLHNLEIGFDDIRNDMQTADSLQEATRKSSFARITQVESDMLGLYDWTRGKVTAVEQETTYTGELVTYLSKQFKAPR